MITFIKKRIAIWWIMTLFFIFQGCTTFGPEFQKISIIPEGYGLIYIYRPSKMKLMAVSYDVKEGKNYVIRLTNGGYFPYIVKTGMVEIWTQTEEESAVEFEVKPGGIYYIRGTVLFGGWSGKPLLEVVPNDVGEKEIRDCKLIEKQ